MSGIIVAITDGYACVNVVYIAPIVSLFSIMMVLLLNRFNDTVSDIDNAFLAITKRQTRQTIYVHVI